MSQQSVRQAARRSALGAQAYGGGRPRSGNVGWRGWRSRWELRWASAAVRDAERRAGRARGIPRGTARTLTFRAYHPARLLPRRARSATQQ
jgi:hypothetical protein